MAVSTSIRFKVLVLRALVAIVRNTSTFQRNQSSKKLVMDMNQLVDEMLEEVQHEMYKR